MLIYKNFLIPSLQFLSKHVHNTKSLKSQDNNTRFINVRLQNTQDFQLWLLNLNKQKFFEKNNKVSYRWDMLSLP